MKLLPVLLLPVALAGCAIGQVKLPMTLGPMDSPKANCLTYDGAPAYGDCQDTGAASLSQDRN